MACGGQQHRPELPPPRSVFNGSLTETNIRLGSQRATQGLEEDAAALPGSPPSAHPATKRDFREAGLSRAANSRERHLVVIVRYLKRRRLRSRSLLFKLISLNGSFSCSRFPPPFLSRSLFSFLYYRKLHIVAQGLVFKCQYSFLGCHLYFYEVWI